MSVPRLALKAAITLALAAGLAACSPVDILNAAAPRGGVTMQRDLAYGEGASRQLDIYAPENACNAPVVVFFYGGSWQTGRRDMYRFLGAALAKRGVLVVVPDYRHYPEVRFPAFMDDAAAAVAWTRVNAARFGGDGDHLFLMGHSAGAQIAALLALDGSYLREAGFDPATLAGMIGLSGPYDFLPLTDPALKIIFGAEEEWPRSQPINFVTPSAPPMFLATGTGDDTVYPRNTEHLAARLREVGVPVTERYYDGVGHISTIGSFSGLLSSWTPARDEVLTFVAAHHAMGCVKPG